MRETRHGHSLTMGRSSATAFKTLLQSSSLLSYKPSRSNDKSEALCTVHLHMVSTHLLGVHEQLAAEWLLCGLAMNIQTFWPNAKYQDVTCLFSDVTQMVYLSRFSHQNHAPIKLPVFWGFFVCRESMLFDLSVLHLHLLQIWKCFGVAHCFFCFFFKRTDTLSCN